ncbi:DUF6777 domain-containing protein [Streptomyces sp. NPDC050698]
MRTPTGTLVPTCALVTVLLLSGCGGNDITGRGDATARGGAGAREELLLQPAAAPGPDPFTDSTALTAATPSTAPRTPSGTDRALAARSGPRSLSGATPGLYGGTERTGSCDIGRQIGHLTRDRVGRRAFARVVGVSPVAVPDYIRALTPVVLRADTRVTGHGLRAGRVTRHQSVLQAGTAVLVDDRGVPRVRCACGNPLRPPTAPRGTPATRGTPWPGYRPGAVIVVTPAPRAVTGFTIVDIVARAWIERRTGHDVRHDRALPSPARATGTPESPPPPTPTRLQVSPERDPFAEPAPDPGGSAPRDIPAAPSRPAADTNTQAALPPPEETVPIPDEPAAPEDPDDPEEVGPAAVPDDPDPPDGAGLIPDDRAAERIPRGPTGVFGD